MGTIIVLLEAISKNEITKIITIGRNKTGIKHDKISEIIHNDYTNFNDIKDILQHTKICYYCLGVYQNSVNKDMFWHITVDYVKALIEYFEQINQSVKFCLFSDKAQNKMNLAYSFLPMQKVKQKKY